MNATVPAKPRLRGVSHQYAAAAAVPMAGVLIAHANGQPSAWLYGICLFFLFAVSATYHRVSWNEQQRKFWRRMDHSMIFIFIAGSYTPFGLELLNQDALGTQMLSAIWITAILGAAVTVAWPSAPKWFRAILYLTAGWMLAVTFPKTYELLGGTAMSLILGSGFLYSLGAIIYARKSPNPWPFTFGYHEIFHILVIAAAWMHYAVIYAWLY